MLIGQWRGYFFLNFALDEGKITHSRLVSGYLATAYAIEKLLLKNFL